MKTLKYWGFGPRKSKSGFTLIELLIVMVILAILAGVVVMAVGGVFGTAKESAYNAVKDDIQNAATGYATDHQGNFPYYNTTTNLSANGNCSPTGAGGLPVCYTINMSALLTTRGGMLREVPDGTAIANCYGPDGATGCSATAHYTWGITNTGIVFSRCDTADSKACTDDDSGYQDQWP